MSEQRDTGQEARDAMANVRAGMGVIRTQSSVRSTPIGPASDETRLSIALAEANQRITTLESELAATKRECEGLRLQIKEARECARCEHPKSTNGFAPWTDCGHCVGCQCKSALAARAATEGGSDG